MEECLAGKISSKLVHSSTERYSIEKEMNLHRDQFVANISLVSFTNNACNKLAKQIAMSPVSKKYNN